MTESTFRAHFDAMQQEERKNAIWSVNAWVGMERRSLSRDAAAEIFRIAIQDQLPDVTETEIASAMAELDGFRQAWLRKSH